MLILILLTTRGNSILQSPVVQKSTDEGKGKPNNKMIKTLGF